jgi:hypothetical protein
MVFEEGYGKIEGIGKGRQNLQLFIVLRKGSGIRPNEHRDPYRLS